MVDPTSNDNDAARADARPQGSDAHGQAAMLLVESLIHGLIARSVISVEDAVEIVAIAADVKEQIAGELGDSPATREKSLAMLDSIHASLSIDLIGQEARPWPPLS
jgi:hypothetical protein